MPHLFDSVLWDVAGGVFFVAGFVVHGAAWWIVARAWRESRGHHRCIRPGATRDVEQSVESLAIVAVLDAGVASLAGPGVLTVAFEGVVMAYRLAIIARLRLAMRSHRSESQDLNARRFVDTEDEEASALVRIESLSQNVRD